MAPTRDPAPPRPLPGTLRWVTMPELCTMLNRSRNTVRGWCLYRGLPYYQPGGPFAPWLFDVTEVAAWLRDQHAAGLVVTDEYRGVA